jgi:hypothetical protein
MFLAHLEIGEVTRRGVLIPVISHGPGSRALVPSLFLSLFRWMRADTLAIHVHKSARLEGRRVESTLAELAHTCTQTGRVAPFRRSVRAGSTSANYISASLPFSSTSSLFFWEIRVYVCDLAVRRAAAAYRALRVGASEGRITETERGIYGRWANRARTERQSRGADQGRTEQVCACARD